MSLFKRYLCASSALTTVFLFAFALAADPIVEENPVSTNSYATVKYKLEKGDSVKWKVAPKPVKQRTHTDSEFSYVDFNGPPGDYEVMAIVVNFDAKKLDFFEQSVKLGTAPQPPPPVPPVPPVPPDPPTPVGTITHFVLVEDTGKSGSWRGDLLGSPKIAALYKSAGLRHRIIDVSADGDDPAAIEFKKRAAGKQLPYFWGMSADAKIVREGVCPQSEDEFIALFNTQPPRSLGALPGKPKLQWKKVGELGGNVPLIPRSAWKSVDLSAYLPPVYDQDGVGECASSAACTVWEAARKMAGLPPVKASAGDLYSRVNGGVDRGSLLEDNLQELLNNGVAPASTVPYVWDGRRRNDPAIVQARRPNRVADAYLCESFEAVASAVQQGFFVEIGMWWYDGDTPDRDGWLPTNPRGGRGGHALTVYGLVKRADGTWGLRLRNSWSERWGVAGNCIVPESRIDGQFSGYWAVRSVTQTTTDFPLPKLSRRELFERADRFALSF